MLTPYIPETFPHPFATTGIIYPKQGIFHYLSPAKIEISEILSIIKRKIKPEIMALIWHPVGG